MTTLATLAERWLSNARTILSPMASSQRGISVKELETQNDLNRRQFFTSTAKVVAVGTLASVGLGSFAPLDTAQATTPDITHGSRKKAMVALTFHGAGDLKIANSLLGILASTKTPVSVFAVGMWLKSNPTFAKQILDGGNDLGNHTMTHFQMKTLSATKVDSEIAGCARELKKLIGNHGSWFRPSGTQFSTPLIRSTALKYGYRECISYEVDSKDYLDPGKSAVIRNVMAKVKKGSIISLHFGHQNTVQALPALLEQLHAKGLMPVTLTTLLGKIGNI
jgi:peptidoglycan/xylan/chitin deacetylase (PgdA/CDA1 family)